MTTRAERRRNFRNSWQQDFLAKDGSFNFERSVRRELWRMGWSNFKGGNGTENEMEGVN